ncbi:MAG: hypothetical protein ACQESF_05720 [Nanobdellota archaeon]
MLKTYKHGKGQVSLFLLIGIVILLVIGIVAAFSDIRISHAQGEDGLEYYVLNCLDQVSASGLRLAGARGGVINPETNVNGFAMKKGKINHSLFEKQVEDYIDKKIIRCARGYNSPGENLSFGTPESNVLIEERITIVDLNMPVNVSSESSFSTYKEFRVEHDFKIGQMIEVLNRSVDCFNPEYFENVDFFASRHANYIVLDSNDYLLATGLHK